MLAAPARPPLRQIPLPLALLRLGIHQCDHKGHHSLSCSHPTFAPSHFVTKLVSWGWSADLTVLTGWVPCSSCVFSSLNLSYAWLCSASHVCLAGLLSHVVELCQGQGAVCWLGPIWGTPLQPPASANTDFRDSCEHLAHTGRCRRGYCPCTVLACY